MSASNPKHNTHIIIYDGVCNLCNSSVNFIIQRDPQCKFLFTPIQSQYAQSLIQKYDIDGELGLTSTLSTAEINTFALIKGRKVLTRSDAVFEVAKDLSGLWYILRVLLVIPHPIRDACYNYIAKNRYRFFGRKVVCLLPTAKTKKRFIGL